MRKFNRNFFTCFAVLVLALTASAQTPPEQNPLLWDNGRWGLQQTQKIEKKAPEYDWTQHFRIGAVVGLNISANFSSKITRPNNAANGIYDDGYVRVDDTGNAGGFTSYWGFNNQSQYNPVNQTLTMHSVNSYSGSSSGSGVFPGLDLAYGGEVWDWGRTRIGWDLGFVLLPISITEGGMSASVSQTTYTFNTGGITWPGAPGPYQGPFNSAGNPTISTNHTTVNSTDTESIAGSHSLDVMLYSLRLGPSLYWDLNEKWGLSAGVGPAVGLVSGSMKFDETVGTVRNRGQIDATDFVYGGYANATLLYHVETGGDLFLGAQFMSLSDATISGGGREGRLNLGGQVYVTAGINWAF